MFRKNLAIAVVLTALLIPSFAGAGWKSDQPVVVRSSYFYGSVGSARNSSNTTEYIGCTINSWGSGSCSARNAGGTYKRCTTKNSSRVAFIRDLPDSPYIYVAFNAAGECTYIGLGNKSYFAPK
jgi:hypothetical protein